MTHTFIFTNGHPCFICLARLIWAADSLGGGFGSSKKAFRLAIRDWAFVRIVLWCGWYQKELNCILLVSNWICNHFLSRRSVRASSLSMSVFSASFSSSGTIFAIIKTLYEDIHKILCSGFSSFPLLGYIFAVPLGAQSTRGTMSLYYFNWLPSKSTASTKF